MKPEEIDPTQLKRTLRGYNRKATDDLLERVAFDYRQATRAQDAWTRESERLKARITELEEQSAAHASEVARLQKVVAAHSERQALIEAMLVTAQRTAQEISETAQQEANATVLAAQERAREIERQAHFSIRQTTAELDRLRTLESDLRTRLRETLEAALGDQ